MLKLVDSDEFEIHSFLNDIKARHNHTIPIIEKFACGIAKIIVTRHELVLRNVPTSVLETMANSFASQFFLEGVQFMHQHNVAHLDLKPGNIVVTPPTNPQRLIIIDFDVSVLVLDQESWIEGYRGTEEWAAPELGDGDDPDTKYQPIRADLWSAGAMLRNFAGPQRRNIDDSLESLANELQNRNPQQRPLLSCIPQRLLNKARLHYEESQVLTLKRKRKLGVDAQEKEGVKRRHVQPGSQVISQDAQLSQLPTPASPEIGR